MFPIPGIEKALLSGGGLRVVRIEHTDPFVHRTAGYGEHPDVMTAIAHADEDYLEGGRPYDKLYGELGKYTMYLTGSSTPSGPLDLWVRQGHKFKAWKEGNEVVFQLSGLVEYRTPEWVREKMKTENSVEWSDRGFSYQSVHTRFPNGEPCLSTKVTGTPEGKSSNRAWMYYATQTGRAPDFWAAMNAAFEAPSIEVDEF
jgi:hypothetical protein